MKSFKKYLIWACIFGFIYGSIVVGGPFDLIYLIIVRPIENILFFIYNYIGDFGLAIILFTILVKIATWPLTKKQLRQTRLIRKLQPELAKIRKNCNGNKQLESLQTMDLYKRYNFKPFGSILILLIQFPIFIAIYSAIRIMVQPTVSGNLSQVAYSFVQFDGSRVQEVVNAQTTYLEYQQRVTENSQKPEEEQEELEKIEYDFHPQLFGAVDLDVTMGFTSLSAIFVLICGISAAALQFFASRGQMSSGKSEKSKKFRDLLKEASDGKEIDQAEINNVTSKQMAFMGPLMMLMIMVALPGALVFYYLLSSLINFIQQKIAFAMIRKEMDDNTDAAITKELKKIQEAEIIENKKSGTKITKISAKDNKKKRR